MKLLLLALFAALGLASCDPGNAESSAIESKENEIGVHYEAMVKHSKEFHRLERLMSENSKIFDEYWGDPAHSETIKLANEEGHRVGKKQVLAYDAFQEAASAFLKAGGDPKIVKGFTEAFGPYSGAAYR